MAVNMKKLSEPATVVEYRLPPPVLDSAKVCWG